MNHSTPKKRIGLFGSTGSIGTQALDVIRANPDRFEASILTAQSNEELLIQQALEFLPHTVVIGKDGKIAWVHSGHAPDLNKKLVRAIAKALQKK